MKAKLILIGLFLVLLGIALIGVYQDTQSGRYKELSSILIGLNRDQAYRYFISQSVNADIQAEGGLYGANSWKSEFGEVRITIGKNTPLTKTLEMSKKWRYMDYSGECIVIEFNENGLVKDIEVGRSIK